MPALTKLDWDQAFDEWILVERPKGLMTQFEFAKKKGVSHTYLSKRFGEIEVDRQSTKAKSMMAKVMVKSLEKMDEGLDELDGDSDVDASMKVKASSDAFKATSDRLGLSPQGVTLQIQNNNNLNAQSNFSIAPFFASGEDAEDFKQLMGGNEAQD